RHTRFSRDWSSDVCSSDLSMGHTAENVSEKYKVSREDQDEFSYRSHQRALAALEAGKFKDEIVPITVSETYIDVSGKKKTREYRSEERRVGKECRVSERVD